MDVVASTEDSPDGPSQQTFCRQHESMHASENSQDVFPYLRLRSRANNEKCTTKNAQRLLSVIVAT